MAVTRQNDMEPRFLRPRIIFTRSGDLPVSIYRFDYLTGSRQFIR
jgi:hypothetical protein